MASKSKPFSFSDWLLKAAHTVPSTPSREHHHPSGMTEKDQTVSSSAHKKQIKKENTPTNGDNVAVTLHGVVEKIVPCIGLIESKKVQIVLQEADDLYREIRFDNTLRDARLKHGAKVKVTIEVFDGGCTEGEA